MKPNPQPRPRIVDPDQVGEERRMLCLRYNVCLDHAAAELWDGFHCNACDFYSPMTYEDARRDLDGFARMIGVVPLRGRFDDV